MFLKYRTYRNEPFLLVLANTSCACPESFLTFKYFMALVFKLFPSQNKKHFFSEAFIKIKVMPLVPVVCQTYKMYINALKCFDH